MIKKYVSKVLPALATLALTAMFSIANAQHTDKESKEDIQRHRAMAAAHEAAAQLRAGL